MPTAFGRCGSGILATTVDDTAVTCVGQSGAAAGTADQTARRPARLLLATPRFFPFTGGIETHVYEVGRRLAERGIEVTVLTTDPSGNLPSEEESHGMSIRRVRAYPSGKDYYFAPGIYRAVVDGEWDIVHCQGVHTLVPPLAMAAARKARIPYVLTFHTGGHSSRTRHSIRGIQWKLLRPLLLGADRLIGVARFEASYFQQTLRIPPERFTVIRNGGSLPDVPETAVPESTGTLIVSIGRLERYKGHQKVISALPHLQNVYPDVRLRIVGTGPYEPELWGLAHRLGVADRVHIEGIPPGDRAAMATVIRSASLVTLLSEYEAHPIAAMEAVALKRPVLVADTSGLCELAEEGLARSVPVDSSASDVARAMEAQLSNPLIPQSVEFPTWERCVDQLLAVYRAIVPDTQCAF